MISIFSHFCCWVPIQIVIVWIFFPFFSIFYHVVLSKPQGLFISSFKYFKAVFVGVLSGNLIKYLNHFIWRILIVWLHGLTCVTSYAFSLLTFLRHLMYIHAVLSILHRNELIAFPWVSVNVHNLELYKENACHVTVRYAGFEGDWNFSMVKDIFQVFDWHNCWSFSSWYALIGV